MKLLISSILILVLTACTTVLDKLETVDNIITSDATYSLVTSVELSPTDEMVINHAKNRYLALREKYKGNLTDYSFNNEEVLEDYKLLLDQYSATVRVIHKNYSKYSDESKDKLKELSESFYKLHDSVEDIQDEAMTLKVVKRLIEIVGAMLLK